MDFNTDREDVARDKQVIEEEIEDLFVEIDYEVLPSEFLSRLELEPIEDRLDENFDRRTKISKQSLGIARLLVYKELRGISQLSETLKLVIDNMDIADNLGLSMADMPKRRNLHQFKKERIDPPLRKLVNYTAEQIEEKDTGILQYGLPNEKKPLEVRRLENKQDVEKLREGQERDWSNYNAARTNEKMYFNKLAKELANFIRQSDLETEGRGRSGYDLGQQIYVLLRHAYEDKGSRSFVSELKEEDPEILDNIPHFNSVTNFYDNCKLTDVLKQLITISAEPLAEMEQELAADASGWSTRTYDQWLEDRTGAAEAKRQYKKAHIMVGANTNVIVSATVTAGTKHDSPEFTELMERAKPFLPIATVSADKAYSSKENLNIVDDSNALPIIPFKENTSGKARGDTLWKKMYQYFRRHKSDFKKYYHQRSNAETTFYMIKEKLNSRLRTKKEVSQKNELLARLLAHNLMVLEQQMFDSGINPEFNFCAEATPAQK
ncbi:MAG: transposase [Candidatus Nanohalobium sp.]